MVITKVTTFILSTVNYVALMSHSVLIFFIPCNSWDCSLIMFFKFYTKDMTLVLLSGVNFVAKMPH